LLGTIQSGGLSYRGLVHFGVGRRLADALASNGLVRSTSPFSERVPVRGVTWLDARLVAEVTYSDLTPAGILRAPVFRGFADEGAIRLM
jgi:bifunctional non-homologous end joining protein LigD